MTYNKPVATRKTTKKTAAPAAGALSPIEQTIARRVAALRAEFGLTLRELGEKTKLSDAYLSRVENGQTALTIASLAAIAEVFATPLSTFLEETETPPPLVICRAGTGRVARFRGRTGTLVSLLADDKHGKLMEPLIVDVPSAQKKVPQQGHAGEEINYVLEGRCRFLFGKDTHELATGDCVYFDATVPHAVHPIDDEPCKLFVVVSSRDFHVHSNIAKVIEGRLQA
jgi:transcriptional regulator with XRE-family HTH domain